MAAQLCLFEINDKKRVRYQIPTYIKFYSLYQYDRDLFRDMINGWLKTDEGKNRTLKTLEKKQAEILDKCYIKDKNGNKLKDSDEKHIYRYITLHKILEQIYNYVILYYMENYIHEIKGLSVFREDKQAEITCTWNMPIKDRVIIHIKLLRLLRKGFNIKEALQKIKRTKKSA